MSDTQVDNMTDENLDQNNSVISQSIGQVLKTARKSQNIEIEQVCSQLNLSAHVVKALESDNYEGLPEFAYVRGYIVSYCRLLGLDSFQVLKQLVTDDPSFSVANTIGTNIQMNSDSQGSSVLGKTVPIVILTLLALGAFWFFTQKDNLLTTVENEVASSNPTVTTQPANSISTDSDGAGSPDGSSTNSLVSTSGGANSTAKTITEGVVDKDKESLLELEFNSVSWVDIQNIKKDKIVYQSFPRGEKHQVKVVLPLNVFIDNAAGVFMRYEGRLIDLNPYIQDGYAKFTLSK